MQERKIVTALFADLTASTELASTLDPEELQSVLRPFFEAMSVEIERFDGTVEKYIGDAVVAVFGAPVAHEDDPERAVRAAVAMQKRLPALRTGLPAFEGQFQMTIGIDTGEVVTDVGEDHEGVVTGGPLHIAARLMERASPGTILVGERTHRDTRNAVQYREVGTVDIPGTEAPLLTFEVVDADRDPEGPRGIRTSPLVGRNSELDLLQLLFTRAIREKRAHLATIVGVAGIGKSRLGQEFAGTLAAAHPEMRISRGRCLPYGEGLTYWPLVEILKTEAGILDSDPAAAMLDKAQALLQRRFGDYSVSDRDVDIILSSVGHEVISDPLAGLEPPVAQDFIASAWRHFFEQLAGDKPLLVLIEDLHWADLSLLDVLEQIAERGTGPILILCLTRPELAERRPHWGSGLENAASIALSPLNEKESELLLRGFLRGMVRSEEQLAPILSRAEGNPFFAEELLRMLIDDGVLVREGGRWEIAGTLPAALPDTVQGVIASRIDSLSAAEKRAIQHAAVVGRIFWQGALESLAPGETERAVEGLISKGLMRERERSSIEGERELIFKHVLTRDVAYESIPRARRGAIHAEVGSFIEARTRGRWEEFAEILAHHFELAEDHVKAARCARLAGDRKRRLFAPQEALRWYGVAMANVSEVQGDELAADVEAEIVLARGSAHEQVASFPEAQADYERALELAEKAGDVHLEARTLASITHILWLQDQYAEGERWLEPALKRARQAGADDLEARLLYTAGTIAFGRGEWKAAIASHEEALGVARASGDRAGEAAALHGLCETRLFFGPFGEALRVGEEARRLLHELGDRALEYENEYAIGWLRWVTGKFHAGLASLDTALAGTREIGDRRNEAFAAMVGASLQLAQGNVGDAVAQVNMAVDIASRLESPRLELISRSFGRLPILGELGTTDLLASDATACRALSDEVGSNVQRPTVLAFDAWVHGSRGEAAESAALFRESQALAADARYHAFGSAQARLLAAEELAEGEDEAASWLAETRDASPLFRAWSDYADGLRAYRAGDAELAFERGRSVIEQAQAVVEERLVWRGAGLAARACASLGRESEQAEYDQQARESLESMAASIPNDALRTAFRSRRIVSELLLAD